MMERLVHGDNCPLVFTAPARISTWERISEVTFPDHCKIPCAPREAFQRPGCA